MNGNRLISTRFPFLPIHIQIRRGSHDLEALLDTGFDGDLVLPPELIADGDPPDGYHRWRLADGSIVRAPYYLGTLQVGPVDVAPIVVTALGDEPLVGRGILSDMTIILDHAQRVIVER
jgi:predicted aspartyl protease